MTCQSVKNSTVIIQELPGVLAELIVQIASAAPMVVNNLNNEYQTYEDLMVNNYLRCLTMVEHSCCLIMIVHKHE